MSSELPDPGHTVLALELRGVSVRYGNLVAVDRLNLTLTQGRMMVLLGVNGAGKSSVLASVAGVVRIAAGEILLGGAPITGLRSYDRARRGLGYLPEGRGVFPSLSVEDNIAAGARSRREANQQLDEALAMFPALVKRRKFAAGTLSGGEQQMLSLARCLAGKPRFLLLDEPSLGLAPQVVNALFAKIADLRDSGVGILLVEQFAHAALRVADEAGVLVRGRLVRHGPAEELARLTPDELSHAYLYAGSKDGAR